MVFAERLAGEETSTSTVWLPAPEVGMFPRTSKTEFPEIETENAGVLDHEVAPSTSTCPTTVPLPVAVMCTRAFFTVSPRL